MIKILIGGSPCTHWSIAQRNNRETEASGEGWELFKNYLIAKEKFQPDFFLYENNKSAALPIKEQIAYELGVDLMYINSALVSAQNRQRFYAFNWNVEQPEDRGILLSDILQSGEDLTSNEKSYCLTATYPGAYAWNTIERSQRNMIAKTVGVGYRNRREEDGKLYRRFETHGESKSNALTTVQTDSMVAQPVRVGLYPNADGECKGGQGNRIYDGREKSVTIQSNSGGKGGKTGLYAIPTNAIANNNVYEVQDSLITIKDKKYPIKLSDGTYQIRKLTPTECERLQTLPDDYTKWGFDVKSNTVVSVSDTQRYKCLGNGWTAEVIIHILQGALKDIPKDEEIVVLSMYDGIATGRCCLDMMGFTNVKYYAYEIDKYAISVAKYNYPDIIECGDAFDVRKDDWKLPERENDEQYML